MKLVFISVKSYQGSIFFILLTLSTFSAGHKIYLEAVKLYSVKSFVSLGHYLVVLQLIYSTPRCCSDHSGTKVQFFFTSKCKPIKF